MLKKIFATLAIAAVPFSASQAENAMPNVLAGLDSSVQVMDEQQLNEVRGTGNLPSDFAFREYYYNYNNYGSTSDFRSYIYDGGSIYSGGIDDGSGAWTGEMWLVNIYGDQYVAETRALHFTPDGSGGYSITGVDSNASWTNSPWDGKYHYHQNYNISL